jgi:cellulose synthase/poly-beta-1,6-N-acetylglucosamine synthase-like glycosyltransferase
MGLIDHIRGTDFVTPFSKEESVFLGQGFKYKNERFVNHSDLPHQESAFFSLNRSQMWFLAGLTPPIIISAVLWLKATLIVGVAGLTFIYFADLLFNLYLIYRSFAKEPEIKINPEEIAKVPPDLWPTYTILCPLYKEAEILPQFVSAMEKMDYPKEKLQILLLLEENDPETAAAAYKALLPSYMQIVIVPHSLPKTKPKACNYGLLKATGEFTVIYDAEDMPEPDQLKKAVLAFVKLRKEKIACVQAKLNFYNPRQNLLTRVFTAEYSTWFDLILTGLQSIHAPIPLGGTSNHFPTKLLREFNGWDAFNVTEDCDLGMRLVKHGYHTAIVESTTWEEANSQAANWFWQRTRWVKGYIQTYLVHMRKPHHFIKNWKEPHVLTFQLVVGGKIMSMFINPLMWAITISYFVFRATLGPAIQSLYPSPILYMGAISLIFGNFLYMYYYMIGCAKRDQDDLLKYVFLVPFYWLAMSAAAWVSVYQFVRKPHHWSKTKHGLHLNNSEMKPNFYFNFIGI